MSCTYYIYIYTYSDQIYQILPSGKRSQTEMENCGKVGGLHDFTHISGLLCGELSQKSMV